jgi:hypothetical protein
MDSVRRFGPLTLHLLLTLGAGSASAQTPTTPPPAQTPAPAGLPTDLGKIKDAIKSPGSFLTLLDKDPLRIYVETKSTFPTFTELVSGFDLKNGPTPYAAVTHQEIVEQSRPKKLNASVGVTLTEGLKAAVLMYTQGKAFELLQAGMRELRDAKTEAERKAIMARMERELAALKGG